MSDHPSSSNIHLSLAEPIDSENIWQKIRYNIKSNKRKFLVQFDLVTKDPDFKPPSFGKIGIVKEVCQGGYYLRITFLENTQCDQILPSDEVHLIKPFQEISHIKSFLINHITKDTSSLSLLHEYFSSSSEISITDHYPNLKQTALEQVKEQEHHKTLPHNNHRNSPYQSTDSSISSQISSSESEESSESDSDRSSKSTSSHSYPLRNPYSFLNNSIRINPEFITGNLANQLKKAKKKK